MNYQDPDSIDKPPGDEFAQGSLPEAFQLIERLSRKLRSLQRQTTSSTGLTPPQYVVLRSLADTNGQPLKDLADVALCTRATITGIVDVLERKDLVERQPNPEDRRSLCVFLTAKGRQLQESTPGLESIPDGCCTVMEPNQTRQLARLLNQLDRAFATWEAAPRDRRDQS
jgi:DNA-binding MarR family transcriptional regulator